MLDEPGRITWVAPPTALLTVFRCFEQEIPLFLPASKNTTKHQLILRATGERCPHLSMATQDYLRDQAAWTRVRSVPFVIHAWNWKKDPTSQKMKNDSVTDSAK